MPIIFPVNFETINSFSVEFPANLELGLKRRKPSAFEEELP